MAWCDFIVFLEIWLTDSLRKSGCEPLLRWFARDVFMPTRLLEVSFRIRQYNGAPIPNSLCATLWRQIHTSKAEDEWNTPSSNAEQMGNIFETYATLLFVDRDRSALRTSLNSLNHGDERKEMQDTHNSFTGSACSMETTPLTCSGASSTPDRLQIPSGK